MTAADTAPQHAHAPEQGVARVNGETAFILGNGPSLGKVDLTSLSAYATVGLNAAYRHWRQIDWRPRYYACLDLVVGLSHKDAIAELIEEGRIERFLLRANLIAELGETGASARVVNYDAIRPSTAMLAVDPVTTGSHSALWAASMGYDQIVLLGIDANYKEVVDGAARRDGIELEIVRDGANPNYYFEGYQATGDRFNLPNPRPDLHVNAWRRAARLMAAAGASVFNGNEHSGVRCFPFIQIDAFMKEGDAPRPAGETLDAFAEEAPEAPVSRGERLRAFIAAYRNKGALAALMSAAAFLVWLLAFKPAPALAVFAAAMLALMLVAGAAFLYSRFTMLQHLHRQNETIGALRARLAVLEAQVLKLGRRRP